MNHIGNKIFFCKYFYIQNNFKFFNFLTFLNVCGLRVRFFFTVLVFYFSISFAIFHIFRVVFESVFDCLCLQFVFLYFVSCFCLDICCMYQLLLFLPNIEYINIVKLLHTIAVICSKEKKSWFERILSSVCDLNHMYFYLLDI